MDSSADHPRCLWCNRIFTPRRDGGKPQMFCRPPCRRAFDAAGRRWVAEAIADATLTLDQLRNGVATTRALLPGAVSPAVADEADKSAAVPPAESPDGASELLADFLAVLLDPDLPDDFWPKIALALPCELFERLDRYLDDLLAEPAAG